MSYFMKIEAVHKKYIGITNFIWLYMCHFMVEFGIIRWLWMKSRFVHDSRSKKQNVFFSIWNIPTYVLPMNLGT